MKKQFGILFIISLLLVSCAKNDQVENNTLYMTGETDYSNMNIGGILEFEKTLDIQNQLIDNNIDGEIEQIKKSFQQESDQMYMVYQKLINELQNTEKQNIDIDLVELENELSKKENYLFNKYEAKLNELELKRSIAKEQKSEEIIEKSNNMYLNEKNNNTKVYTIDE